jgi:hypothetical protein
MAFHKWSVAPQDPGSRSEVCHPKLCKAAKVGEGVAQGRKRKERMTGKSHAPPSCTRCLACLGYGSTTLDNTNQEDDHRNNEEDMDEAPNGVGADHPE